MIEIDHLTKRYGSHTALSDLSLTVEPGQIYGFLGPNGAGKSTTMNIMTGCLAATEGTVRIDGYDIFEEPAKAKALIGYLPEQPPVYPDMTPLEYLDFVARAKGVDRSARQSQLDRAMEVTQIQGVKDRLIKNLSKGYKQRVGIAQALLGEPHVIILDEPTVGLDPIQIIEIRDLIQALGEEHTVILSSHILSEVRAVCRQIMILSRGRLVASDTPDNLEKLFAGTATLELTIKGGEEAVRAALAPFAEKLTCQPEEEGRLRVCLESQPSDELSERVFYACAGANLPILRMDQKKASLEDVFLELTAADPEQTEERTEPEAETDEAEEGGEEP
ncbi:ABC transporter ATP-binding protein [uncultured Flavonifractor sp.]|uniref:ABC transporter ATP-binding protein n=1 Tax=uncultured Flavonifractor sp. TaxID=1193534 RepID=UPI00261FFD42|nr:ABC transporter ATP-binding protein [uncultured Flavonifractor sp.]